MQTGIEVIFWYALVLTLYVAIGYPCLLRILARFQKNYVVRDSAADRDEGDLPTVSVVVPAWNDERQILDRLQNLVESDFPPDRLEIIVGCDLRADLIGDLVQTVNDPRVRVVRCAAPRGTSDLVNACLRDVRHEIVVLTNCNIRFNRQTIRHLVRHFFSPHVGAVCGQLLSPDAPEHGEPEPVSPFELTTRFETPFGVVHESGGTVAAYQAELIPEIPAGTSSVGLAAGLTVYRSGLRIVRDDDAVARRRSKLAGPRRELFHPRRLWNGLRTGCQLVRLAGCSLSLVVLCSHWLRRNSPVFVILAMMGNAVLARDHFYLRLLILHEAAYLALLIYLCLRETGRWPFGPGASTRPIP